MLFKNILFASSGTAGSDNAAKLAFGLAEKQQAELTLYHCCGVPSRGFTTNVTDTRSGSLEQPDEAYQEMVREELNTAYAYQIEACTRPFRMELSVGMPSTEILRYARQIKPDLIVMGASSAASDPNAARMRSIVGNTVRAVAKKAPCPVLIVNRPCTTCWHLFSNVPISVREHAFATIGLTQGPLPAPAACLEKPCTPEALLEVVNRLVPEPTTA